MLKDLSSPFERRCPCPPGQEEDCPVEESLPNGLTSTNGYASVSLASDINCPEELRFQERMDIFPIVRLPNTTQRLSLVISVDKRTFSRQEAFLNLMQTLFICFLLVGGVILFSSDANKMVLKPLERMSQKVIRIGRKPLEAIKMADEEYKKELSKQVIEQTRMQRRGFRATMRRSLVVRASGVFESLGLSKIIDLYRRIFHKSAKPNKPSEQPEAMETVILEKTIIKLGTLLALGFGEAGAQIVAHNLQVSDTAGINVMIPGIRVNAVFGYLEIREFALITDVLVDKVMIFVNQVSEIVHGIVDEFHGAPNKNFGETFLVVWALPDDPVETSRHCDLSILSFSKIIAAVNRSPTLADYRLHPGLLQRNPQFRVRLGMSLHMGWAIEGAIGSEFKIDASYLSPNVTTTQHFVNATTDYECTMLISHFLVEQCSKLLQDSCRQVDSVVIGASKLGVIRLYTFDLDHRNLEVEDRSQFPKKMVGLQRFKAKHDRQQHKDGKLEMAWDPMIMLTNDKDITNMRDVYSQNFFDVGEIKNAQSLPQKLVKTYVSCPKSLLTYFYLSLSSFLKNLLGFRYGFPKLRGG